MLEGNPTSNKVVEPGVLPKLFTFLMSIKYSCLLIEHGYMFTLIYFGF